ncbi:arrestin domain-containing protein 3 [Aedes albopictus]|uniref:Arrestin C-terminal-like domain-containing protein n=1 Tax=Aedes albopictus TaxID=7160 RepID=A0ABM2A675_AEDAL|nr:arrestin domain-containing protein 3-like [Aedes albopictus]XP_029732932.1 arrestin domain-containing protein 3-like [Aedes albopictus]
MPTTCKIWLTNDTKVYNCGEKVEGTVELTVTETKRMNAIRLIIAGVATVDWDQFRGAKKTLRFKGSEACFDSEIDLLGANGEEVDVQAGTSTYSFDCYLPDSLPPSFEGEHGRIQYIITVVLQRSGRVDKTFTIEFTVRRGLDLNAEPSAVRRPARVESSNTFRCWPCRSGPLLVEMQVPATGFVPGQRIPVVLEVSNRSGCKIHLIQLKLVMVVAYTSDTPRVKVKTYRQDVTGAELDQIDDPDVVRYEESILVPQTPVTSSSDSCKIIQIVYELEAELEVGALHQVTKLAIPIVIGTVPLDTDRRESTIMEIES